MHILHIVGSINPAAGGPTEVIRMLIEHQPPGYTSEVVTTNDPAEPFLQDFPFKITALGTPKQSFRVPSLTAWLRENRHRFDGIILHGLWEYTGIAVLHAIAGHTPYVVFPHGMLDPYFKRRFPLKHLKKLPYWLLNDYWLLRRAQRVLFTTQIEADLARQSFSLSQWTPMVVALGAESPQFDIGVSIPIFFNRCPEVRGKHFLLFLGRIHPKKGPDLLLEAFAAANDPNLHLVMAGPGAPSYIEELQAITAQQNTARRVHWPGMLQGQAKWGALAACDAFALTSHQENFGIAVVEALACGRPVLLSDQINIAPDCLADGCALVAPDTLEGATHLLQQWQTLTAAQRSTMSRQALHTFTTRYDMRRNTEAILRVFEPQSQTTTQSTPEAA